MITIETFQKKILLGVITYDSDWYCLKRFAEALGQLDVQGYMVDYYIIDNSDSDVYQKYIKRFIPFAKVAHYQPPPDKKGFDRFRHCEEVCRQMIVDAAIKGKYDNLFFVDSDVILKEDTLKKLMKKKREIVCALFRYRNPPQGRPLWFRVKRPVQISPKTGVWLLTFIKNKEVVGKERIMEIDACGFGAILINTQVLKKIHMHKSPNDHYGCDIHFCFDAKKLGYKIFGDPTAEVEHLYKQCSRRRESNANAY